MAASLLANHGAADDFDWVEEELCDATPSRPSPGGLPTSPSTGIKTIMMASEKGRTAEDKAWKDWSRPSPGGLASPAHPGGQSNAAKALNKEAAANVSDTGSKLLLAATKQTAASKLAKAKAKGKAKKSDLNLKKKEPTTASSVIRGLNRGR